MRNYLCVNDFAPQSEELQVYFKKVKPGKKSDGFAVILGGEVYLIDVGGTKDEEMLRFLGSLWEKWLERVPDCAEKEKAKLEINILVSHSHPDHIGGMHFILDDDRFAVRSFYAPERSVMSIASPEALPKLTEEEDKLDGILQRLRDAGLPEEKIHRIPYGKTHVISPRMNDARFTIFTSPFDWSEDRPSDSEGIRFLKQYVSPTYKDHPEAGWTNGILNGNSLWVKIEKGSQAVLITGDQRSSDEMLGRMIRHHGEENFRCDVLKLPHHGDRNYPNYLLDLASPKITIFTVDKEMPLAETKEHCEKISTPYYLGEGNLILTLDGKGGITSACYE